MASDLHIHVFEGIDVQELRDFFRNTLGSKYFSPLTIGQLGDSYMKTYQKIFATPDIWIGEVIWLKAAESFVPNPVGQISEIIGEDLPVITEGLITLIGAALEVENSTEYSIANKADVVDFLRQHIGKKVFTVSW